MWDVSPYTLHEHGTFSIASRAITTTDLTSLLISLMIASCSLYPRLLLHVLIRTLGIITRNLPALIAPVIDVADLFR